MVLFLHVLCLSVRLNVSHEKSPRFVGSEGRFFVSRYLSNVHASQTDVSYVLVAVTNECSLEVLMFPAISTDSMTMKYGVLVMSPVSMMEWFVTKEPTEKTSVDVAVRLNGVVVEAYTFDVPGSFVFQVMVAVVVPVDVAMSLMIGGVVSGTIGSGRVVNENSLDVE